MILITKNFFISVPLVMIVIMQRKYFKSTVGDRDIGDNGDLGDKIKSTVPVPYVPKVLWDRGQWGPWGLKRPLK
jgi:hypothetical protein